jgi:DNA-binding MarR family transcriptional regulator
VPSTISDALNSDATPRRELVEELTAELTSWSPREFIFSFRRLHRGNISLVHLNVLALVEAEGPMPMGKLADALDVSVASLTGIVSRMELRGLVQRVHSEHDRRVVLVRQTDAGAEVFLGIDEHRRMALAKLASTLTDEQISGLLAGHRALRVARLELTRESSGLVSVRRTESEPTSEEAPASR